MFSEKVKKFRADIKFAVLFGSVFWIAALVIYLLVFAFIFTTLRNEARSGIQVRLLGYWAIDQSGGLDILKENIDVDVLFSGERPFFVRISDEFNNTVLLTTPANWSSFNFSRLEQNRPRPGTFISLHSENLDYVLEVGSISISDNHVLQVGVSDENRHHILQLLSGSFVAALLILVFASIVIGSIMAGRFLLPVHRLEHAVGEVIETGRIESRIEERKSSGELDRLVVSFNHMLEKIEELVRGMKGALDTVAHDLRTPLTRFRMVAEKALSQGGGRDDCGEIYREALEDAVEESDTVLRMMNMLMDISEAETGTLKLHKTDFSPLRMLTELADVYSLIAEDKEIVIDISGQSYDGTICADADRFRQAAGNLIDNAVKYGKPGGSIKIGVVETGEDVEISIADDGEGIRPDDLPEIWTRLYRGKSSHKGLGLGLSLVNAIMKAHGGRAEVRSIRGEGSVFKLIFPC